MSKTSCMVVTGLILVRIAGVAALLQCAVQRSDLPPVENPHISGSGEHYGLNPCNETGRFDSQRPPAVCPLPAHLRNGLVYVRIPKTGSTSFSGVLRRIGHRRGLTHTHDDDNWLSCQEKVDREPKTPAVSTQHAHRVDISGVAAKRMPGAFYVTALREPAARCLSAFYFFEASRNGVEPTAENKISFMRNKCVANLQFRFTMRASDSTVSAIMESYGFVAVNERFDESLLLLAKKLGVGLADVLYIWKRKSGSSVSRVSGEILIEHPPLSQEPKSVQEAAKEIYEKGLDAQLFEAANLELDRLIADYGPSFGKDLAEFRRMLAAVLDKCQHGLLDGGCAWCSQRCIDSVITDPLCG